MPKSKLRKDHKKAINRRYHRKIQKRAEIIKEFRREQMEKLKGLTEEE